MNTITIEVGEEGVALLTIDVPGSAMNVLTPEFESELSAAIERIRGEDAIKGAVITSGKRGAFIAGADLKDLETAYGRETLRQTYARSQRLSGLYRRLESCGKPVAAAINGPALGGGLELCLACHYRALSNNPKAVLGLPEVKVGLLPGAGGTQRLPRMIGIARALPLLLDGNAVAPDEALRLGIVDAVRPPDQLVAKAREWVSANRDAVQPWDLKGYRVPGGVGCLAPHAVESFQAGTSRLAKSSMRNYPALPAISAAVFEGTIVPLDLGLRIESKYFATLLVGPVARNLMRTMIISKGAADRLVRRPAAVAKCPVGKLGVLGAGMMGAGIAYSAAAAGIQVVLIDTTQELADKGKAYSANLLHKAIEKGRETRERADALLARITATTDYAALAASDLVVEAVFESRDVKRDVTVKAAAVLPDTAIFASNTSTLPISGLSQAFSRPGQFVGIHFFSPVERMPLVEIIKGELTGDAALAKALDFVEQLRKTSIVVNDSPGFFTSRVFGTFVDEGMAMLAEGVEPALIENAARMAGMPVGPLAVSDEVTIELQLKVHEQALADALPKAFQRLTAIDVVKKMVGLGRIGRRGGAGFYEYPPHGKKRLWAGLRDLFPTVAKQPEVEELRRRFLYIQALETVRCLEEGVIDHPADADLGSILGIGYPSWTGGALSFVETIGLTEFVRCSHTLASRHGARFEPTPGLIDRAADDRSFYGASTGRGIRAA
ncbi:MAG TPA: 3-hydroxyacyl-CoA dehydrogenase NAD-binding domain-containing protein [Steroidobacteraceae bacterium]|jgi:3-hydroxyacyl-CoA dehydrogenase/enoyl-CoA hydratase/3-hydroxybutyryl-CoA epimerase